MTRRDTSPAHKNQSATSSIYQEYPYPNDGVVRRGMGLALRACLDSNSEKDPDQALNILDIGCGTGEVTAGIAMEFPNAKVVAIDVNPPSLDSAKALADKHNLEIAFDQVDLEGKDHKFFDQWKNQFDIITSFGVLHHLRNPATGFQFASDLAKTDAHLMCFMYSSLGRRDEMVVKMLLDEWQGEETANSFEQREEMIKALSVSARHTIAGGLMNVRKRLKIGPRLNPLELIRIGLRRNVETHRADTFSNPCEHLYRFSELRALFIKCGWQFNALAPNCGLPTSLEQFKCSERQRRTLASLPEDLLYDYFAFLFRPSGFTCFLDKHQFRAN